MAHAANADTPVAVVGGGVVGVAVAHALACRGVGAIVLEAQDELALGASGTNSGILHTGFDSTPGELETRLILRSADLREAVLARLGVPVLRCGALLRPRELGLAADPPVLSALARSADDAAGARVLPALSGLGAPWWRPEARAVLAGLHGATTGANVARAALEGIAWRVADVVAAVRDRRRAFVAAAAGL